MGVYDSVKNAFGDYDLGYNIAHAPYTSNGPIAPGFGHAPKLANGQSAFPTPGAPAPGGAVSGPTSQPRSGAAHFGAAPVPVSGPASEARSGPGHFGAAPPGPAAPPPSPYGTQSGPGILENWFNERAGGTDPAYEYAMKRGMESLGNSSAAAGSYNSGAARQQESDFAANMGAQREGQLDALASGASGEHLRRNEDLFGQGNAIAAGRSGINSAYDLANAKSQSDILSAILGFTTGKAGVDDKSRQQGYSNIISGIAAL